MNQNPRVSKISGNDLCKELLVIGPESEFAPSDRHRLGLGNYKYIGFTKLNYEVWRYGEMVDQRGAPVYMLEKDTTSRISLILNRRDGSLVGWVSIFRNMSVIGENITWFN